jgi:ubiquinone/menaquinone biosynthesis C-methylase UbiE
MKFSHYKDFFGEQFSLKATKVEKKAIEDESIIQEGNLINKNNAEECYPIINGIPRILKRPEQNYSENFGLQWNKFKSTQYDSVTGLSISNDRFWENSRWSESELYGKVILEVGSGAGRFTEVLAATGATIVSFDLSSAVEANFSKNGNKENVLIFQGDIYQIPFPDGFFDYILCYGVLQHTPNPESAYNAIFKKLKSGGKISIDYYRKLNGLSPWSTPKYFWRPLTKKMKPQLLLKIIKIYMPLWLPIDTAIRSIPKVGDKILSIIPIPCWNYLGYGLTYSQRLQWAILDTFDALAPAYDFPKTKNEIEEMVESQENASVEIFYGGTGIVCNIKKR